MILASTFLEKFYPKPSEAVFSTVFCYNFRMEVDNDVISSAAVDNIGMDVRVKLSQTVFDIFEDLISCQTSERTNRTKSIP